MAYCFGGLELAHVMAGEIKEPEKNIPRSILISAIIIGAIYIVGSLLLIVILTKGRIDEINGLVQSFSIVTDILEIQWVGWLGIVLITLGTLGLFGSWLTGNTRTLFRDRNKQLSTKNLDTFIRIWNATYIITLAGYSSYHSFPCISSWNNY